MRSGDALASALHLRIRAISYLIRGSTNRPIRHSDRCQNAPTPRSPGLDASSAEFVWRRRKVDAWCEVSFQLRGRPQHPVFACRQPNLASALPRLAPSESCSVHSTTIRATVYASHAGSASVTHSHVTGAYSAAYTTVTHRRSVADLLTWLTEQGLLAGADRIQITAPSTFSHSPFLIWRFTSARLLVLDPFLR
uniref:Uncharacterized protein n=1 Tax=Mycena chlorophos TaxID=658473 RepID=A0ABQ0L918_MYCCL|nr:predicted protein [Mycena chlorophos]